MNIVQRIREKSGAAVLRENQFASGSPRILFYCASNIGLGHLGRLLRVAGRLRERLPGASQLLATDARPSVLEAQAPAMAALRLPHFVFTDDASFQEKPFAMEIGRPQLQAIRRNLLLTLAHGFQPDLVYMDTLPHGKRDEMQGALKWLRKNRPAARTVLCMRDIPCAPDEDFRFTDPARVEKCFSLYDRILIAGDRGFFHPAEAYGWPQAVRDKTRHVGFFAPQCAPRPDSAPDASRRIIASFGGGWEAQTLGMAILQAARRVQDSLGARVSLDIITGPATAESDMQALRDASPPSLCASIESYASDLLQRLATADLAILQAGSTVFQVLESDLPLIVYFRDYKDREQQLRAERLSGLPGISTLGRSSLSVETLAAAMLQALRAPRQPRQTGYCFDGIENAASEVLKLLGA